MAEKRRILVTGGAGFIGSHTVVQLIEAGFEVHVVDDLSNAHAHVLDAIASITGIHPGFSCFDLCDSAKTKKLFAEFKPDAVIHFAAKKLVGESVQNPLLYYKTNLQSLVNVVEASLEHGCHKIVFSSSCTVYGQPDQNPVSENAPLMKPESPYGNTKRVCEEILQDTVKAQSLQVVSLRYFNPVGAHASALIGEYPLGAPSNLMPVLTQTAIGKRTGFSIFGSDYNTPDGTCIRDYIHVVDLANAHVAAIQLLLSRENDSVFLVYNIGTGSGVSVKEMVESFERVNGLKLNYEYAPRRAGDVEQVWANNSLALQELGWKPELGLDEMVASAWKWEQHLNNYEKSIHQS
ncbi:MAG: UDP-glucose 4-epimerase GalE [Bacteroidota bacterium]